MALSAEQVYGFSAAHLVQHYDNPTPIPWFHKEMWEMCCSDHKWVAIAAPRAHAKSTAITHAFGLASALFGEADYILIVSDTEAQAINFLNDIRNELAENEDMQETFGFRRFTKDAVKDIIVELWSGRKFRIQALGSEQKIRGRKWNNKRPDLIICDDLENDELVESKNRRYAFRNWFFKALVKCLSRNGRIRVVGTILHMDSLLFRLLKNKSWYSRLYKAHESFDNFDNLLWPEQWPKEALEAERQVYMDEGIPEGYSQELLNNPIDHSNQFFRREDFIPMEPGHKKQPLVYYVGVDFAISQEDHGDFTVMVVGGMDAEGILNIIDVERFKGDTEEIISCMFALQRKYDVDAWKVEQGSIHLALESELYKRMRTENIYLNLSPGTPKRDKLIRARPIQGRMRAEGVRFDKEAHWYPAFEEECLQFPKGGKKDQVDAFAWLGIGIHEFADASTQEEIEEDEYQEEYEASLLDFGVNQHTGY